MTINMMMDQRPQYSGAAAHHPSAATKPRHIGKTTGVRNANTAATNNKNHKPAKLSMPVQKQRSAPPPHSAPAAIAVSTPPFAAQPKKIAVHELFSMYASHSDGELSNASNERAPPTAGYKRPLASERQRAQTSARAPTSTPPKTTTMGAFATPAYADSPSARELPPPPTDWLRLAAAAAVSNHAAVATKPARAQTMPFTGVEFLRVVASQC
jgi:hypothetical protein